VNNPVVRWKKVTLSIEVGVLTDGDELADDSSVEAKIRDLINDRCDGRQSLTVEIFCKSVEELVKNAVEGVVHDRCQRVAPDRLCMFGTGPSYSTVMAEMKLRRLGSVCVTGSDRDVSVVEGRSEVRASTNEGGSR